ncbi:four helix bundle protein [Deminuibacter soli]|uniref:Four helix bundle protein n=1 Tax=Deminuibacter soli TaxID=2291815 RepID=A0A3E1NQJ9_9BACT|nr:four helix bundle protein [Deminuibacter soli]RFM30239.1 four helix bundle protein [Deminuibacter soli]
MAAIKKFEDILSWQKARELTKLIGQFIDDGRFKSNFRLINQLEGAAGSIMDNIAEGFERSGNREFMQFLYISKGSCGEFRSQLYRALDREYFQKEEFSLLYNKSIEIAVLIQKLIDYLDHSALKGSKYKHRDQIEQ